MSSKKNNIGLPFLPGFSFPDITKTAYHRPQTLVYSDGFNLPNHPTVGIGGDPLMIGPLNPAENIELCFYDDFFLPSHRRPQTLIYSDGLNVPHPPSLTDKDSLLGKHLVPQDKIHLSYHKATARKPIGPPAKEPSAEYIPPYMANDKVLRFYAYFQEECQYSNQEMYRVRPVVIYYYLLDNTMEMYEPAVENSGIPQGKRITRHCFPKGNEGDTYMWKDLNIGIDFDVYGVKYRITHCDESTKTFMERGGIRLNDTEQIPLDPYTKLREFHPPCHVTPSCYDCRGKFLAMNGKVMHFSALWEVVSGGTVPVIITYWLVDDTVEIREVPAPNTRKDSCHVFRRQKMAKRIKPGPFPSCVLELSNAEVEEYYTAKDFQLGKKVNLVGYDFLLLDCDLFTKRFYKSVYPDLEMIPVELPKKEVEEHQDWKKEIPPYNGFGLPEDSLQNCLALIPQPYRRDVKKMLEYHSTVLHYTIQLDSPYPEHQDRNFTLFFYPANDTMAIYEKAVPNSGIIAGKYLKKIRVPKPGTTVDNPEFYTPADFAIGAKVEVFGHRFVVIDAAQDVLNYLETIPDQIPPDTLQSIRQKLGTMAIEKRLHNSDSTET